MGKSVQIVTCEQPRPGFVRIEIDRSLTGTGHESYPVAPESHAVRPVDELARNLFETDLVQRVHVFSNVITITLKSGLKVAMSTGSGSTMGELLKDEYLDKLRVVVEQLFVHYRPGVLPTPV